MIICESEFERLNPKNPDFAAHEVDIYMHIPYPSSLTQQHRLSIRKNLKTGMFEAYRHYTPQTLQKPDEIMVQNKDLATVIDFTNAQARKYWGHDSNNDQVCDHQKTVGLHCQMKAFAKCVHCNTVFYDTEHARKTGVWCPHVSFVYKDGAYHLKRGTSMDVTLK